MPKRVRVLTRTLPYGNQLLGKGGEYTVSDAFAKEKMIEGKVELVADLGNDATPLATDKKLDQEFMEKVKHHAPEIMQILESEFERQRQEKRSEEKYQEMLAQAKKEESGDNDESNDSSNETESVDVKNEEISTSTENVVPSDEPGGIVTTADNSSIELNTPIPEDFPGFTALQKNDITTMEQLSALSYDDLIEKGIRQGTANQIGAKLMELKNSNA